MVQVVWVGCRPHQGSHSLEGWFWCPLPELRDKLESLRKNVGPSQ